MKRRTLVVASVVLFAVALGTTARRCTFPIFSPTWYSYLPRERPRVFVSHHPLRAEPGQSLTIKLTPDLVLPPAAITRAVARIGADGSATRQELACTPSGSAFECAHTLPAAAGTFVYDGSLTLDDGTIVRSQSYRFRAVSAIGSNEVLALREPVAPNQELSPTYTVKTVFVRDAGDGYNEDTFVADVEHAVYDAILSDPAYRWRDTQLGFYQFGSTGITTSYYSGFDTRCGQNPWPELLSLPAPLRTVDAIGIVHRHPNTAGGVEGEVTSTNTFRDCAGIASYETTVGTFSAVGSSAHVAKHEYGHAAFGLGDEYNESDATRRVTPAAAPSDSQCCCARETGPIVTPGPGGTGTVTPGGTATTTGGPGLSPRIARPECAPGHTAPVSPFGLSSCGDGAVSFPAACSATPQGGCPTPFGHCINDRMWLGQTLAAGPQLRPNVFPTEAECNTAKDAALIHPGVEEATSSLETACRQLCGSIVPCPCNVAEAWIVDRDPAGGSAVTANGSDTMGTVIAVRHGGTCQRCVDASLCVRWERGRGQSADEAWAACEAPPQDAAGRERGLIGTLNALMAWFADVFGGWLDP